MPCQKPQRLTFGKWQLRTYTSKAKDFCTRNSLKTIVLNFTIGNPEKHWVVSIHVSDVLWTEDNHMDIYGLLWDTCIANLFTSVNFLQILVIFVLGACFAFFFAGKIIGFLGMVLWKGQRTSIWNKGIPCCLWTCQISIIGSTRSPSLKLYPSIYGRHCEVWLFSLHPSLL